MPYPRINRSENRSRPRFPHIPAPILFQPWFTMFQKPVDIATVTDRHNDNKTRRSQAVQSRWITAWVCLLVVLFVVPTLFLARAQRESRRLEKHDWATILNPSTPDPGHLPNIDIPTDGARRVSIGFYMESIIDVSLHDSRWNGVIDVWCRCKDDPTRPSTAAGPMQPMKMIAASRPRSIGRPCGMPHVVTAASLDK